MGSVSEDWYSGVRSFVPRSIISTFSRYPGAKVRSKSRDRVVMTGCEGVSSELGKTRM